MKTTLYIFLVILFVFTVWQLYVSYGNKKYETLTHEIIGNIKSIDFKIFNKYTKASVNTEAYNMNSASKNFPVLANYIFGGNKDSLQMAMTSPVIYNMSNISSFSFIMPLEFEINNLQCIECDFWIIYGGLPIGNESVNVNPKNIFLITAEFEGAYSQKFLRQFEKVITIDTKLQGDNLVYDHVGYPWFINNSFDELYHLDNVKKNQINFSNCLRLLKHYLQ